jgi:hypothetical protein
MNDMSTCCNDLLALLVIHQSGVDDGVMVAATENPMPNQEERAIDTASLRACCSPPTKGGAPKQDSSWSRSVVRLFDLVAERLR